jgi:Xaa-Pro aminopeptidase
LDELRLALGPAELDRYRAAGSDAADAFLEALDALRPELSELGAAGELARPLVARGFTTPVVLVGGERRAPVHRHPLPTRERLGRFALLAVTAEREGLYVSLTRIVSFGAPPGSWSASCGRRPRSTQRC